MDPKEVYGNSFTTRAQPRRRIFSFKRKEGLPILNKSVINLVKIRKGKTPDKYQSNRRIQHVDSNPRYKQVSLNQSLDTRRPKQTLSEIPSKIQINHLTIPKHPLNIPTSTNPTRSNLQKLISFYSHKIKTERKQAAKAQKHISKILHKADYSTSTEVMKSMAEVIYYNRAVLRKKILDLPRSARRCQGGQQLDEDYKSVKKVFESVPQKKLGEGKRCQVINSVKRIDEYRSRLSKSVEGIPKPQNSATPRRNIQPSSSYFGPT
ncbi:unnamed protein product [Moneuplotes crassus]|uniref:Uncharacterized protein n=1 Tax=Euplotes crassus TaxID=5936 RepID=A0AAD2DCJ6_EUPCR|nr:unnamed protein product [Moneuplotes crassus]